MARIAKSLDTLRDQINAAHPNRSKVSDGWIGDPAHAGRKSDHNPNSSGVVCAFDATHDIDGRNDDFDAWKFAEALRLNRDARIGYVICNSRIFSGPAGTQPWVWRKYTGANNHAKHTHVSVRQAAQFYDDPTPWKIEPPAGSAIGPAPVLPLPKGVTAAMRRRMMQAILGYEGRFDGGQLKVFIAPDGLPEIGGITQKDHPATYAKLKSILDSGNQKKLREEVLKYYEQYTSPAQNWTDQAGLEFFLRDCILNRGPAGAAEILQMAVGVKIDREVGPTTRGALKALPVNAALDKLRSARERYEDKKYGKAFRVSRGQWAGLVSRWDKALALARALQAEQSSVAPEAGAAGGIVATGTGAVVVAVQQGIRPWQIALIVGLTLIIAAAVFVGIRSARNK